MEIQYLVGGSWLAAQYGVALVMPLSVQSRIGGRRVSHVIAGITTETFVQSMRPSANLRGHLTTQASNPAGGRLWQPDVDFWHESTPHSSNMISRIN